MTSARRNLFEGNSAVAANSCAATACARRRTPTAPAAAARDVTQPSGRSIDEAESTRSIPDHRNTETEPDSLDRDTNPVPGQPTSQRAGDSAALFSAAQ